MLQLLSISICSGLLLLDHISNVNTNAILLSVLGIVQGVLTILMFALFLFSWVILCRVFFVIYGSLYHLRKKRFVKYTKPVAWIYEKFFHKAFYETNYRPRTNMTFNSFTGVDASKLANLKTGGTILLLYDDSADYFPFISNFIKETIGSGETIDFISTYKVPVEICKTFEDSEIPYIAKHLSIIDCFSTHYAFDDKVIKYTMRNLVQKGFHFYQAESFADIHTAANDSWYRFRKTCQAEENSFRIPHRTIYDTLSSLVRFSSDEMYFLFLRHVISSEKTYGMISTIIEPQTLEPTMKSELIRMVDVVIEYSSSGFNLIKSK